MLTIKSFPKMYFVAVPASNNLIRHATNAEDVHRFASVASVTFWSGVGRCIYITWITLRVFMNF